MQHTQKKQTEQWPLRNLTISLTLIHAGVGKTCVLFRFSEDQFNSTFISTIGVLLVLSFSLH